MKSMAWKWGLLASAMMLELILTGCVGLRLEYGHELARHDAQPPVLLPPAPVASLTCDKQFVIEGQSVTLQWHTENATSVRIDPVGIVSASGSLSVTPSGNLAKYHLVAEGTGGVDVATVWVNVIPQAPISESAPPT